MYILPLFAALACILTTLASPHPAQAGEDIRVLTSTAMRDVLQTIAPEFQRSTGHTLRLTFESAVGVKRKIEAGAAFDLAIATPAIVADLAGQGKLVPGPGTIIARAGYGVAIRAGAARPDIRACRHLGDSQIG